MRTVKKGKLVFRDGALYDAETGERVPLKP
jgi:hypothetical protein